MAHKIIGIFIIIIKTVNKKKYVHQIIANIIRQEYQDIYEFFYQKNDIMKERYQALKF